MITLLIGMLCKSLSISALLLRSVKLIRAMVGMSAGFALRLWYIGNPYKVMSYAVANSVSREASPDSKPRAPS